MAKKKNAASKAAPAMAPAASTNESASAQTVGYDVDVWAGQPRYQCKECPVDSLDEEFIKAHVLEHQRPFAPLSEPAKEA